MCSFCSSSCRSVYKYTGLEILICKVIIQRNSFKLGLWLFVFGKQVMPGTLNKIVNGEFK